MLCTAFFKTLFSEHSVENVLLVQIIPQTPHPQSKPLTKPPPPPPHPLPLYTDLAWRFLRATFSCFKITTTTTTKPLWFGWVFLLYNNNNVCIESMIKHIIKAYNKLKSDGLEEVTKNLKT